MIVLPMAGLSSRFLNAGYTKPKYMLDLHGVPVFDHALGSFAELFDTERFLVICRDIQGTAEFVRARCAALGLSEERVDLVILEKETAGQAETVAQGIRSAAVPADTPITIFNIDTFRPGFTYPSTFDHREVDGYLEVFEAEGTHWSFVRAEAGTDRVIEVTEKVRISDLCSDGLYHFRDSELFVTLYSEIETREPSTLQGGEYYVAPLYNIALRNGCDIRYTKVNLSEIRFCGTPEEYEALLAGAHFLPIGDSA